MKYKITPLFIIYVIALAVTGYYWLAVDLPRNATTSNNYEGLIVYFFGGMFLIALVADLTLRLIIKNLKTIWIIEIVLIVIVFFVLDFGSK